MSVDEGKQKFTVLNGEGKGKQKEDREERKKIIALGITNFTIADVDGKEQEVPLSINDTVQAIRSLKNLYKIGGKFYGKINNKFDCLSKIEDVFSFIQENDKLLWIKEKPGFPKPKEIFSALYRTPDDFDLLNETPTYPALSSTYYNCEHVEPQKTGALDQLLEFFNPATSIDAALIKAAVCAPAWSGGYGEKPMFLFKTDEKEQDAHNTGKSTLLNWIGIFYGGRIQLSADAKYKEMATAIVMMRNLRIISFDNVQKPYLGNGDLESAITSPWLQGHELYKGPVQVRNHFTWIATMNGPNLSPDLASRSVVIRVLPPKVRDSKWEPKLGKFFQQKRQELLADIGHILMSPIQDRVPTTRFSAFDDMILHKFLPEDASDYVRQGQDEVNSVKNDDSEDKIVNKLYKAFNIHLEKPVVLEGSPEDYNWWVPSEILTDWLTANRRVFNNSAGADGRMLKERLKRIKSWDVHAYRPKIKGIKLPRGYFLVSKTEPKTKQVYFVKDQHEQKVLVEGGILPSTFDGDQ